MVAVAHWLEVVLVVHEGLAVKEETKAASSPPGVSSCNAALPARIEVVALPVQPVKVVAVDPVHVTDI
jgi:hypothetical protein